MVKRGFTLIELLVVIAIIAILAGILFPVFASARTKARSTQCLSNTRQVASAAIMYVQDFTETFPTVYSGGTETGNSVTILAPYIKNRDAFYCPDRPGNSPRDPEWGACQRLTDKRCLGFGYNWGIGFSGDDLWRQGIGLVHPDEGGALRGKKVSAVVSSSNTFFYGESWDSPRYTLWVQKMWPARHNKRMNFVYVDGHASSEVIRRARSRDGYDRIGLVTDLTKYCADPGDLRCVIAIRTVNQYSTILPE